MASYNDVSPHATVLSSAFRMTVRVVGDGVSSRRALSNVKSAFVRLPVDVLEKDLDN